MKKLTSVLLVSALSAGCSILFMEKPPPGDSPVARGYCTRSIIAPVADVVYGVVSPLGVLAMVADDSDGLSSEDSGGVVAAAAWAAAGSYSAVRGFGWSGECKRRNALSEQAIADYLRKVADRMEREP
ncbi:hypothetical protein [Candidatus Palauibacter sp.]|uniref:hypothetical protein n=1 Tax=Candidatus Palauibacter sp. TaxID=3101350 RepID=UPI003B5ABE11